MYRLSLLLVILSQISAALICLPITVVCEYSRPAREVCSCFTPAVRATVRFAFPIPTLTPLALQQDCLAPDLHFQPYVCLRLHLILTTKEQNSLTEAAKCHADIADNCCTTGHAVF